MTKPTKNTQTEARFLDLDALAPEVAVSILINGNKHEMAEMSVADFVWAQKLSGEQSKLDPSDMDNEGYEKVMQSMIEVLSRQFPTCPRKEIEALPIVKLTALIKFTGQLGAEGAEAAIAEAAEEGKVILEPEEKTSTDQ